MKKTGEFWWAFDELDILDVRIILPTDSMNSLSD